MLSDYKRALAEFNNIPPAEIDGIPAERCSNGKQKFGSTFFRQDADTDQAIESKGWKNCRERAVIATGESAFHEENFKPKAKLMRFLASAKAGGVRKGRTVLVFAHENRYTRARIGNGMDRLREFINAGVYVYFANSNMLLLPGWEHEAAICKRLIRAFNRARLEIATRQEYATMSHKKKIEDLEAGRVVNTGNYPHWVKFVGPSNKLAGKYVESDELVFPGTENRLTKWDVAVRIKDEGLAGKSASAIAKGLNEDKIPPWCGGKMWRPGDIRSFLKSRRLLGVATLGGGMSSDGSHYIKGVKEFNIYPAVCTEAEWQKIQQQLAKVKIHKRTIAARNPTSVFPRMAICSECGGQVSACGRIYLNQHSGKWVRNYKCRNHNNGMGCSAKRCLPIGIVELDFFGQYLQQSPETLLNSQDPELKNSLLAQEEKVSALGKEYEEYEAHYNQATNSTSRSSVLKSLNKVGDELEKAVAELQQIRVREFSLGEAPNALNEIQGLLRGVEIAPANAEAWRALELTVEKVEAQLEDAATRCELAALIPDLIGGLVLHLNDQKYDIKNLKGEVIATRDLSIDIAAARKENNRQGMLLAWQRRRQKGHTKPAA